MSHAMLVSAADESVVLRVECALAPMPWSDGATCGVGRLLDSEGGLAWLPLSTTATPGEMVTLRRAELVPVPAGIDAGTAALVPALARSLWLWDRLGLELGELAVVSEGHPLSSLAAVAASWYGARTIVLRADGNGDALWEEVGTCQPVRTLGPRLAEVPGVAAAELNGGPDPVDVLLEALPRFARLMLAGARRERLTIDFYTNVHRKGITLFSALLDPAAALAERDNRGRMKRALRLLGRPARAAECRQAAAGLVLSSR